MSKKEAIVSAEGQDVQTTDSVFDFLYHDSRRIASYLSQFDNSGALTGVTASEGVTKGAKRGKRIGFGGNTPVGGGNLELEIGPGEAGSESLVRVYDPFWANALQFLDVLDQRGMIQRDLEAANVGQFVLVSGFLSIQDLGMMKDAWKTTSLQRKMLGGAQGGKKIANMTSAQKAALKEEKENTEMFLDMIQLMPHSVHARLLTIDDQTKLVWCAVNQEYLVMPPSDISLTYGNVMSGEWSILGILSAHPEYLTPDLDGKFDENNLGLTESIVGQITKILSPIVRVALGRPSAAFAVTPLLIFREVA
ncbi:hypothetical protein Q9K02_05860 [Qipengyuania sp. G39]|uniref:Major capsid protein n=1 Tax=Qipengyuania profundimaris TaxID=3067652 RepID=A0ABT9HND8_9SPHN|nr:hypothetical protein [Qipengyuania sp. G39]MDP4574662.1 hypothetical protein [Qipengyuania sp. G39]